MKVKELQQIIKKCVKEVFQEEMKELLLEAIKNNKNLNNNSQQSTQYEDKSFISEKKNPLSESDKRKMYLDLIEGKNPALENPNKQPISENNVASIDTINGELPQGNLGLDKIKELMGNG